MCCVKGCGISHLSANGFIVEGVAGINQKPCAFYSRCLFNNGRFVRELRKKRKLSQEALALDAGLGRSYVSLIEQGKRSTSLKTMAALANVLGVNVSTLILLAEAIKSSSPEHKAANGDNAKNT